MADKPTEPRSVTKPDVHGHRARIRKRFIEASSSLHDYELLELILCMAQPRIDVKPLAKRLIRHFGGFAATISASASALSAIDGVGESTVCIILTIKEAVARMLAPTTRNLILNSSRKVLDYCQASMAYLQTEQFRVLYLNSKNFLIKDEIQNYGTIDEAPLYTRELMKAAMNYGASGIILVHNHPSGDPKPSLNDVLLTREVYELAKSLKIHLHDHIIVARGSYFSFRAEGILGALPETVLSSV